MNTEKMYARRVFCDEGHVFVLGLEDGWWLGFVLEAGPEWLLVSRNEERFQGFSTQSHVERAIRDYGWTPQPKASKKSRANK